MRFARLAPAIARRAVTIVVFLGLAAFVYDWWMGEGAPDAQPILLTIVLCMLFSVGVGFLSPTRMRDIVVLAYFGMLIGPLVPPSTSRIPGTRGEAILAGAYSEFRPFSMCAGSCLGALVGMNLVEMRTWLNRANGRKTG